MEIDPLDGAIVNLEFESMVTESLARFKESDPESEPLPPSSYSKTFDPALLGTPLGCCGGF